MTREKPAERFGFTVAEIEEYVSDGMPEGNENETAGWLLLNGHIKPRRVVTRKELASYFGTSLPNVSHWLSSGLPNVSLDQIDLDDAIKWRLDKLSARQSESKEALLAAKADREELAVDRECGRLADAYEIDSWRRQTVASIRSMLDDFADLAYGVVDRGYSAADARLVAQEKITAIYQDLEAGEKDLQDMLSSWYTFLADNFEDAERWLMVWKAFCEQVVPQFEKYDELVARLRECGFTPE